MRGEHRRGYYCRRGCRRGHCRRRSSLLFLPVSCALLLWPTAAYGQGGLPPGPGWTAAGPLAPAGGIAFDAGVMAVRPGYGWRICAHRPFGVPDLIYREGWLVLGGRGVTGGVRWRQLSGDGMRLSSGELGAGGTIAIGPGAAALHLGGGLDLRTLSAPDHRTRIRLVPVVRSILRTPDGWRAALLVRLAPGGPGWTDPGGHWSLLYGNSPLQVGIGGSLVPDGEHCPALLWGYQGGPLTVRLSLWGRPPAPALALGLRTGGLLWVGELRWVPGPGFTLLWSVGTAPGGDR